MAASKVKKPDVYEAQYTCRTAAEKEELTKYIAEMKSVYITKVETLIDMDDEILIEVHIAGDMNECLFCGYLLKKYKEKVEKLERNNKINDSLQK